MEVIGQILLALIGLLSENMVFVAERAFIFLFLLIARDKSAVITVQFMDVRKSVQREIAPDSVFMFAVSLSIFFFPRHFLENKVESVSNCMCRF